MGVADRISRAAATPEAATPFRRPSGRASYPHRITLDLDEARYQWLRGAAYEARVPAAAILRAAMDALANPALLQVVIEKARAEYPAP